MNTIELDMINCFWHKPTEAEEDTQIYNDDDGPEEYNKSRNASVVQDDDKNEEETEEADEEEEDHEVQKKIQSLPDVTCCIAPTIPHFMTRSVQILAKDAGLRLAYEP